MKIHRFYLEKLGEEKTEGYPNIILENKELVHQILKVFRMEVGDKFNVFRDKEYSVEIAKIGKNEIVCKILKEEERLIQKQNLTLAFAMIKKENMELVLNMCTQLGVASFVPLITERTIKIGWNFPRMQKILIEATEQSGWGEIPHLAREPLQLEKYLQENSKQIYVLDLFEEIEEKEKYSEIKNKLKNTESVIIFIGPEGGFSDSERELFKKYNLQTITLGKNVLRAETAAVAISSQLLV